MPRTRTNTLRCALQGGLVLFFCFCFKLAITEAAPTGTISINSGVQYTNTAYVTLTLSATDSESGMGAGSQMQFSNDNVTWSTAEAYATTKAWVLTTGDGNKAVYVKFKNVAGAWSSAYSATILLDTIAPLAQYSNSDPTKLILHSDGPDASTVFKDELGHVVTAQGNAQIDTAQSKFGGSSALFDGNGDYLTIPDSDDWNFGSGDFTIDFWVRFNSVTASMCLFSQSLNASNRFELTWGQSVSRLEFFSNIGGVTKAYKQWTWVPIANTWYHIALVRSTTNLYCFINGTILSVYGTPTPISTNDLGNIAHTFDIGEKTWEGTYPVNGWLDEFRISKGIARWTANFTPPAQPYDAGNKFILRADGPDASTAFKDDLGHVVTVQGNAQIDTAQFKFGGSSALFDGNGDYLTTPDSNDWNFGSGDFTIDFWFRPAAAPSAYDTFVGQFIDNNNLWRFDLGSTGLKPRFRVLSGGAVKAEYVATNDQAFTPGTWYHITLVRNGLNIYVFKNGLSIGLTVTTPISTSVIPDIASTLTIGYDPVNAGRDINGHIDELRISKGIARWTTNFTPPAASILINSDSVFTSSTAVTLTLSAQDTGGSGLSQMQFSNDGFTWSTAEAYAATKAWTLASGSGQKTVYARFKDSAGNWSEVFSDSIFVESTPPTGTIIINSGSQYAKTASATLTLSATDTDSGMGPGAQMKFSNDNATWSTPEAYTTSKAWTLTSGDGTKTVYVKFMDKGGNWSSVYPDAIFLDATAPLAQYTSTDPTKLILYADGADSSTAFKDELGHVVTAQGNAQIDTAQSKFGGSSALFDGNGDYLTTPDSNDWNFGSSDFTVDFWVRFSALPAPGTQAHLIAQYDYGTSQRAWYLAVNNPSGSPGAYRWVFTYSSAGIPPAFQVFLDDPGIVANVWYHIALSRSGGNVRLFRDGSQKGATAAISGTLFDSSATLTLGCILNNGTSEQFFSGWLDEVRISKGIARWTTNFTLPAQPYDAGNKLILRADGADTSTAFKDDLGHTVTAQGNAQIDTAQSKFGGSSALFDGNGDYLTTPDSNDWNFGSGDFTIDFWFRPAAAPSAYDTFIGQFIDNNNLWRFDLGSTGLKPRFRVLSGGALKAEYVATNDQTFTPGTWYHITLVRNGLNIYVFKNGLSIGLTVTTSISTSVIPDIASALTIGYDPVNAGRDINGHIDELRISKGIARWTANFAPPAASILINNDGAFTSSTAVTLTLSAQDTGGSGLSQMQLSNDGFTWSSAETYATTKAWTLASGSGQKTVYARFKDSAGNWSEVVLDSIVLDTTPPTGTILINSGVQYVKSTSVTLTLSASDSDSGMGVGAQMQFSNDNVTWSTPEAYAASKTWVLTTGDGQKTAYVKFKDAVGNWSDKISATIILKQPSTKERMFIYLNNQRVAMEENGKKYFYHNDQLGGTNTVTDEAGQLVEYSEYKPFGEVKVDEGTLYSAKKFTGKELDESTGLYDYGARQYDAKLGRFITPDTILPKPDNPQSLNRYSYCLNNPLKYVDPSGHSWVDAVKGFFGAAFDTIKSIVMLQQSGEAAGNAIAGLVLNPKGTFDAVQQSFKKQISTEAGRDNFIGSSIFMAASFFVPGDKGLSRSSVISRSRAIEYLVGNGFTKERALSFVNSIKGSVTARLVESGEEFYRYTDWIDSTGSFLTKVKFNSPKKAIKGMHLEPWGNDASYVQTVSAIERNIVLEGKVANGKGTQTIAVSKDKFYFDSGRQYGQK